MPVRILTIPIQPKSKPRGQRGKYGNITHSAQGYRTWQSSFGQNLRAQYPKSKDHIVLQGLILRFYRGRVGGSLPDLDNLSGGVLDALKKFGVVIDDNIQHVQRLYQDATIVPRDESAIKMIWIYGEENPLKPFMEELRELLTEPINLGVAPKIPEKSLLVD